MLLSTAVASGAAEIGSWDSHQPSGKPRASGREFAQVPLGVRRQHRDWKLSTVGYCPLRKVSMRPV